MNAVYLRYVINEYGILSLILLYIEMLYCLKQSDFVCNFLLVAVTNTILESGVHFPSRQEIVNRCWHCTASRGSYPRRAGANHQLVYSSIRCCRNWY